MKNLDDVLSEYFNNKIMSTKSCIMKYLKPKIEVTLDEVTARLNENYACLKNESKNNSSQDIYFKKEDENKVIELIKNKENQIKKIIPIIDLYLEKNIIGTCRDINAFVKSKMKEIPDSSVFGNYQKARIFVKKGSIIYYYRKEDKEKAEVLVNEIKNRRNEMRVIINSFLEKNFIGSSSELINEVKQKTDETNTDKIRSCLNEYNQVNIISGFKKSAAYYYRKENESIAKTLLNELESQKKMSLDSFFERNLYGTRQQIISFFEEKGVNKAARTTIFDQLKNSKYIKMDIKKGTAGRPEAYFFEAKKMHEARAKLKKLELEQIKSNSQ